MMKVLIFILLLACQVICGMLSTKISPGLRSQLTWSKPFLSGPPGPKRKLPTKFHCDTFFSSRDFVINKQSHGNDAKSSQFPLYSPIQARVLGGPNISVGTHPWETYIYLEKVRKHKNIALLPQPPSCGPIKPGTRILGGSRVSYGEFPWMALIYYHVTKTAINEYHNHQICGGSIINKRYILSSAHCFMDFNPKRMDATIILDYQVVMGNVEGVEMTSNHVIVHEKFDGRMTRENDIALLRLTSDIQFEERIKPICLPIHQALNEPLHQKYLTIAGWGYKQTEPTLVKVMYLYKLAVRSTALEDCKVGYAGKHVVNEMHVCTRGAYMFSQSACPGDYGGPVMWRSGAVTYQMGVVSWGGACDARVHNQTNVSLRITAYMLWILDHIQE